MTLQRGSNRLDLGDLIAYFGFDQSLHIARLGQLVPLDGSLEGTFEDSIGQRRADHEHQ